MILLVFQKLCASSLSVDTIKTGRIDSLKSAKDSSKFDVNHFIDSLRREVKLKQSDTLKFSGDLMKSDITKHNTTDTTLHPNNNLGSVMIASVIEKQVVPASASHSSNMLFSMLSDSVKTSTFINSADSLSLALKQQDI